MIKMNERSFMIRAKSFRFFSDIIKQRIKFLRAVLIDDD